MQIGLNSSVAKEIAKKYDDMWFELLGPYGINRDNVNEYVGRLLIKCVGASFTGIVQNHEVYLDGEHIMTVQVVQEPEELEEGDNEIKLRWHVKIEKIWEKTE